MATVSLFIRQDNDPIQIRQEIRWNTLSFNDMGYLIKRSFYSVTNTVISLLQWLAVILIGYSPLWAIVGVGVFLWLPTGRRLRSKLNDKIKERRFAGKGSESALEENSENEDVIEDVTEEVTEEVTEDGE
ncbi:MAG: hypothetical protein FWF83_00090 [Clostridiales bacterium]|nr:hypothetical protein [Clostridiales bacterium]